MSGVPNSQIHAKPGAWPDPVALTDKVAGFVDWCEQTGRKVLVEWLMYYLDLSDEQAADLKARNDESSEVYKKAVSLCRGWLVDNAAGGSWRDSVAIFCLKNHYGYTDSSKIEVDSNITVQFRDDELAD